MSCSVIKALELQALHCGERGIEAFTNVLVRRVGELVDETDNRCVSGEALFQDVLGRYVRWQPPRALNLDAVVEDTDVDVIREGVVPVK